VKNYIGVGREVLSNPGWRSKLMAFFAPPGWSSQTNPVAIYDTQAYARFETPTSRWQKIYGIVATLCILALVLDLLKASGELSMPVRVAWTLFIAANTASLAVLLEGKRWGIALEALRSGLVFGAMAAGFWIHAVTPAQRAAGIFAGAIALFSLAMLLRKNQASTQQLDAVAP